MQASFPLAYLCVAYVVPLLVGIRSTYRQETALHQSLNLPMIIIYGCHRSCQLKKISFFAV